MVINSPRPITWRPFKLTSEMELFYAITLFNFPGGGSAPVPCPYPWASMIGAKPILITGVESAT